MYFELILFGLVVLFGAIIMFCRYVVPSLATRDPEPIYLDYARSFFPVFLIVFLLRGFVTEPFRIPSGSMLPGLEVGDFILVNKFSYGLRLPILRDKILNVGDPERGDTLVFKYPQNPELNYIKRVVGLPGDVIAYRNKRLSINGVLAPEISDGTYIPFYPSIDRKVEFDRYTQVIPSGDGTETVEFSILKHKYAPSKHNREWVVPQGHYMVLGDNRDNSQDSRFWGFVPEENIVGEAFFIWFHYNFQENGGTKFSRIGNSI